MDRTRSVCPISFISFAPVDAVVTCTGLPDESEAIRVPSVETAIQFIQRLIGMVFNIVRTYPNCERGKPSTVTPSTTPPANQGLQEQLYLLHFYWDLFQRKIFSLWARISPTGIDGSGGRHLRPEPITYNS